MDWQTWVEQRASELGLKKTSGYRTPAQERALGGPASSFHTKGSPTAPGALDIGGAADRLTELFREIREAFAGRINELYLNLPGGGSEAIKRNEPLSRNPEAGRPQHLHVAIGGTVGAAPPAAAIPLENRGEKALEATGECGKRICPPDIAGNIRRALGETPEPQTNCWCWSDIWIYGIALAIIVGGSWMALRGKD